MFPTTKNIIVITTFVACAAVTTTSAEDLPETARAPAAAMELLGDMAGDWETTVKIVTETGEWKIQSINKARITSHLNGLLFTEEEIERIEGDQGSPRLKVDYTYDQYRNVYRVSAVDSGWGLMDIYEGALNDGVLVLTNLRSGTSFPSEDGGTLHFQLRIPTHGDEKEMEVNLSSDGGTNWRPFYKINYLRIPK